MSKIYIDFHYNNSYTFNDSIEHEDVNGYFYKRCEDSKVCYRYTFDDIEKFIDFFINDFEETIFGFDDDFVSVVITVEK